MKKSQIILLIIGLSIIVLLVFLAKPEKILAQILVLKFNIFIILLPYIIVLVSDTYAWKYVIISKDKSYNIWNLFMIKLAGDFVNNIAPAGSIAGEPVKAHILKNYKVNFIDGMASVYMSKLMMAKSQVFFILLGIILTIVTFIDQGSNSIIVGAIIFVSILTCILLIFYYLGSNKGIFNTCLIFLDKIRLRLAIIEKQKEHLNLFDEKISYFYKNHKREFIISFFLYLFGWFASVIELYITLRFLNVPISVSEAIIIESLNTIGRSLMFFIPGQVGTQEGTLYLLFRLFPTITSTGNVLDIAMAYSIIRRIREFIWLGFGMIFLSKFNLKLPKLSIKKNKSIPFKSDFQENNPKKNQD